MFKKVFRVSCQENFNIGIIKVLDSHCIYVLVVAKLYIKKCILVLEIYHNYKKGELILSSTGSRNTRQVHDCGAGLRRGHWGHQALPHLLQGGGGDVALLGGFSIKLQSSHKVEHLKSKRNVYRSKFNNN